MRKLSAMLVVLTIAVGRFAAPGFPQDFRSGIASGSGGFAMGPAEVFSNRQCIAKIADKEKEPRGPLPRRRSYEPPLEIPEFKEVKPKTDVKLEGTVLDEMGEPAQTMEIHLLGLDTSREYWGCTDSKGRYSIGALAGNYTACIIYKGQIGLCRDFTLRKGQNAKSDLHLAFFTRTEPVELSKRLPARSQGTLFSTLRGTVYGEAERPVKGIQVEVRLERDSSLLASMATTDSSGAYTLTVPPGEYVACVLYQNARGLCRAIPMRQGRLVVSDFDLRYFQEQSTEQIR